MKKIFVILGIASIVMTACNRETLPEVSTFASEGTHLIFTATTDVSEATKTTLGTDGVVNWTSTDQIQVNASTANEANTFTIASCDGNTATFTGTVKTEGTEYYALYPASAFVKFDAGQDKLKIQFDVPSVQTACLGGFADNVNIAVAHTSGSSFTFLNVLSYVYFDLQQDNVTKVELTTNSTSEYLAAKTCKIQVKADATGGDGLTYSDNPGGDKYKTVSIGNGSTVLAKGVYYLALFPCDRTNKQAKLTGFTMTLTNNEGLKASKTSTKTLTVARGTAKNLGTISGLSFVNTLEADKSSVNVSADAGSTTVKVTSSTSWTAAISGDGFSIDNTSGSGDGAIIVSYTANTSTASTRSATLTITSEDGSVEPVTVSFTQEKKDDTNCIFKFTLGSSTETTQTATGGTITFGAASKIATDTKTKCGYSFKLDKDPSYSNTKYALVKSKTALAVGDTISISGWQSGTVTASSTFGFLLSTDLAGTNKIAPILFTKKNTEETLTYTIKTGDVLIGQTDFYISRNPSNSVYFSGISIAR